MKFFPLNKKLSDLKAVTGFNSIHFFCCTDFHGTPMPDEGDTG